MKIEIDNGNIWSFQYANKLTKKDMLLLMEAVRRKHFLRANGNWVGLGFPSLYKSKYFKTHDGDTTPKICHWWVLTEAGEEMMKKIESTFDIPEDASPSHPINTLLFSLGM